MSSHKLRFVPDARADLKAAERYTVRRWGEEQRNVLNKTFQRVFQELAEFPELGRQRSELGAGMRTLPSQGYVIVYLVDNDAVTIVRVIHERMMSIPAIDTE